MSITQIRNTLEQIINHMEPHWNFVNCHMVNFFTEMFWEKYIPPDIKTCIDSDNIDEAINFIFSNQNESDKFEGLATFLSQTKRFRLENFQNILTSQEDLYRTLSIDNSLSVTNLSIGEFMSEKKRHEVEKTAELISKLVTNSAQDNHYIVDAGDGKGYLSSRLALEYKFHVLGIDANNANTKNAVERNKKLERAWNGLTERAVLLNKGIIPPRRGKKQVKESPSKDQHHSFNGKKENNYQTDNTFITTDLDFVALVCNVFKKDTDLKIEPTITLTGLHTCGNLASTCLKVFTSQPNIRILCNIGCCYHLLNEEFSLNEFFGNKSLTIKNPDYGFPLSEFLREKKVKLGRNARMLAAQSVHRTVDAKELPNRTLFYRALLEMLIIKENINQKEPLQVGKIKNATKFAEYVEKCNQKLDLGFDELSKNHMQSFEENYTKEGKFLDLFYLIRMSFAPVLETIILLDRLLYLKENDFDQSFLVPLFNPIVSPRCYCVVSVK